MQWVGAMESWQVACTVCMRAGIEVEECADSVAHRYGRCLMAVAAWKWAQQVLRLLGLEYFGTMSGQPDGAARRGSSCMVDPRR
jgi:hypothetical protein